MATMTTHERVLRMFEHREADRIAVFDCPWGETFERWHAEGLPTDVPWDEYLGLDRIGTIFLDVSPRYPARVIEETADYVIATTEWGATLKTFKHKASTPQFLDFTITDPAAWTQAKARMTPTPDRVDWARLEREYPVWRKEGRWVEAYGWFGFDVTHAWAVGTERLLEAMMLDPDWASEMFNHYLDVNLALLEMVWERGYRFDSLKWPDDMGFKHHQFFSLDTYRAILRPVHERAVRWAHAHGVKAHLHSCGDVNPFIPDLIEIGVDALNPLEVKAGMDPVAIKRQYGDRLALHGGVSALLYTDVQALEAEVRRLVPIMKEGGGYIFSSDHTVPSSISLKDFSHIMHLAMELGRY